MIRVATYNIRKAVGTDRKRNPERIVQVVNALNADIVVLQEADFRFGQRQGALPLRLLEECCDLEPVPFHIRPNSLGWHGNAILVRNGGVVRVAEPLTLPMLEPRGAVMAELEVAGQPLRVVGMHLDLSGLWRRRQIRALLEQLDNMPAHLPTILMGDMNQWSDRGALSEFAFHHFRLIRTPPSYHSNRPVAALDRIIVSHDFRLKEAGVHLDRLSRTASDHLPVWADLELH